MSLTDTRWLWVTLRPHLESLLLMESS